MAIAIKTTLPTSPIVEVDGGADLTCAAVRDQVIAALERGQIVVLPQLGFELTPRERDLILDTKVILPTQKEQDSRVGRPTLIFDPAKGRIEKTKIQPDARRELEAMLGRFSDWAQDVVFTVLPSYRAALARDRATYRPCDRSVPQGLHMDSSYGRPTQGRGMLRLFCNINPLGRPRVWQVGEPFESFVGRVLPKARNVTPRGSRLLHLLGITRGRQTSFDRLMAELRGLAKGDEEYQRNGPRAIVEFPSGSSWLAITDLAIHGAVSGQHSLDQTFFLPVDAMRDPARASIRILERLTGKALE